MTGPRDSFRGPHDSRRGATSGRPDRPSGALNSPTGLGPVPCYGSQNTISSGAGATHRGRENSVTIASASNLTTTSRLAPPSVHARPPDIVTSSVDRPVTTTSVMLGT